MNYLFFSNIFRALVSAEAVALKIKDEDLLAKSQQAKVSVLTQFDNFFPSEVDDAIFHKGFNCKSFFEIIAEFPYLVEGREKKFLSFIASVALYCESHPDSKIVLDRNVIKIMASRYIDNYVWQKVIKSSNNDYFIAAVEAVLPLLQERPLDRADIELMEVLLPSWKQAFPAIAEAMKKVKRPNENLIRSECYL